MKQFSLAHKNSADQARLIWKKVWFSDIEILGICGQISCEGYEEDPLIRIETLNTEKLKSRQSEFKGKILIREMPNTLTS